jgi:GNAT superfamily N-acetyltransferase
MNSVLHFRKQLNEPPVITTVAGIVVRSPRIPDDVADWLALRERAMAGETPVARPWTAADFRAELISKAWWREDRTWLAECEDSQNSLVGSVMMALREGRAGSVPVVHWLLVEPAWRRRGIGRLLMSLLEREAWEDGWREVQLETHSGWSAAVAFYHSIGYEPLREPSPR